MGEEIPLICLDCANVNDCSRTQIERCYREEDEPLKKSKRG